MDDFYYKTVQRFLVAFAWTIFVSTLICHDAEACSGRKILNTTSGVISDGPRKYPPSAHCEWLIDAGSPKRFISLTFEEMKTECSYDYLFVYDGDSYMSPLLGSFSGSTIPDRVLARSGYMLIYFYSDRNYVLEGFDAKFKVYDCPMNCSGNGECNNQTHICTCSPHVTGEACDIELCPNKCGDHGKCDFNLRTCICEDGFTGTDCGVAMTTPSGEGSWHLISPEGTGFQPRSGHAGVFIEEDKHLYIFGGFTLNNVLDEFIRYDFLDNQWHVIPKSGLWPKARQYHTLIRQGENIFMFGGLLSNKTHSNELWKYEVTTGSWTLLADNSTVIPEGVASHTMTLVEDTWIYLFGGRTSEGNFLSDMYRINISNPIQWETVKTRGGKEADRRLVGHSTVYHKESKSLLVFGGFSPDYARFPKRTNYLFTYHIKQNYWSQLYFPSPSDENAKSMDERAPKDRAFHSAHIIGNYMAVFGGNSHIHHKEEICYDKDIYFYHLGCHRWVRSDTFKSDKVSKFGISQKGRFSHVAVTAFGNTLIVSGGYKGNVLGDLIAYTVPTAIGKNWNDTRFTSSADHCDLHGDREECHDDPECVWCTPQEGAAVSGCISRKNSKQCTTKIYYSICPGICSALQDCGSCTVQGQGAEVQNNPLTHLYHNQECAWCVIEGECQGINEFEGACNGTEFSKFGDGMLDGWWGRNSSRPMHIDQCRLQDHPAGLHWIKYRHPQNYDYPDEVELIKDTAVTFSFEPLFDTENIEGKEYVTKFAGYLHPLGALSSNGPPLRVYLVSVVADVWLYISTDDNPADKELVAELNSETYANEEARRQGDGSIFSREERGYKYFIEQKASQKVAGKKGSQQVQSTTQLEWTGALEDESRIRHHFTLKFLEPYNSNDCSTYMNCMACMTDTSCGWCITSGTCVMKSDTGLPTDQCGAVQGANYLVMQALDCPVCADYIECESCAKDELCEWLSAEARCLRRGRFPESVTDVSQCPVPCRQHTNCSSCVGERSECAWCEQTEQCFPFVEYMMLYAYGGCMQWVDSMSAQQCHDCSLHMTCKDCLADFQCGWCGDDNNPTIGRCLHGDFTGPETNDTCTALVADVHNVTLTDPASWSYGLCPDVEECRLGLHDCHENATCENTFESYICSCDKGFTGDGRKTCDRTCYYDCIHGTCSDAPDYICECDIGWTGDECKTNCECNNHSTCKERVGLCDECQDWTHGDNCEFCKPGSYGNATSSRGCTKCNCNGHGNEDLGYCDSVTGKCFCKDNTEGDHCESCKDGYYGDPKNGNKCYLLCEGRTILGNITNGALGYYAGTPVSNRPYAYCFWILTVHPDLNNLLVMDVVPTITFTMETDIKTVCSRDYVYVYDGIPTSTANSPGSSPTLLAAFCGFGLDKPVSVEAKSGYISVYFEGNIETVELTKGFNASFHVNSCPSQCDGNRACLGSKCVCKEGFGGINCETELCPRNCSIDYGQGICDKILGQCVCTVGFGGSACADPILYNSGVFTPIYDPWRVMGINAFNSSLGRMGHSLVTCDDDVFYMFGGYSLSRGVLNDLWKYNVTENRWIELIPATEDEPTGRYHHAAVCVPTMRAMYIYGGLIDKVGAVKEIWKYTLDSSRWSKLEIPDLQPNAVPAMAGHTMTLVDNTKIWIIGGFASHSYFNKDSFEYDVSNNEWIVLQMEGSNPTGLYGHSSVYHPKSHAVYVFGGYEYQTDKAMALGNLYSVDTKDRIWSLLPPEPSKNQVLGRFFHAAATTKDYMIVIGGRTSLNGAEVDDFDNTVAAYKYDCNQWVDITSKTSHIRGEGFLSVIGAAAIVRNYDSNIGGASMISSVYMMAGFNGNTHGTLTQLTIPNDICTLYNTVDSCLAVLGCSACVLLEEFLQVGANATYCYANTGNPAAACENANGSVIFYEGKFCTASRIEERDCLQHKTCSECLAKWPAHRGHSEVCQWCSNCPKGKCIPKSTDCEAANSCRRPQRVIAKPSDCVEKLCQASDCDKCWAKGSCIWTRQFKRSSEVGRTLSLIPIYDWNCVTSTLLEATTYNIPTSPPKVCPMRCYQHTSCGACLESEGSEGGAQECIWSISLHECMPPAYIPLHCSNGECGHILKGEPDICPQKCSIQDQCSKCLSMPGCGWCAFGGLNGLGVCMEGGLTGPGEGECSAANVSLGTEPLTELMSNWSLSASSAPSWSFGNCPPENECINVHHTCDESEKCTDLMVGYKCECRAGYKQDPSIKKCTPDCQQSCKPHGDCVAPNECRCHFGYVGHNCSTECQCNKHSNCESVILSDVCKECFNDTQGKYCEECKPLFVGNPKNGGQCESCFSFCNQHTNICMTSSEANASAYKSPRELTPSYINSWISSGPVSSEEAVCVGCKNNTIGDTCESCKDGFYRLTTQAKTTVCTPCQCHGHSDLCNKESGINCDCKNNTKSPRCDNSKQGETPCSELQCSLCVDNFLGDPVDGHQCYRQMAVDREYCFDPATQMHCNRNFQSLLEKRTVFFAVQPKYLNVDIRIVIDVTEGGLDVYFAPFMNAYTVFVEKETGIHKISIDNKYKVMEKVESRKKRHVSNALYMDSAEISDTPLSASSFIPHRKFSRDKREASLVDNKKFNVNSANSSEDPEKVYMLEDKQAADFNTFITVMDRDTFLVVRDVKNRLVITLPNHIHDLQVSRFYMILHGKGSASNNQTSGILYFRQDQPHIDLFVFFSVFFSCFFLFLAVCVLLWKVKQAVDSRRSRQRRRMEMQHMASRPFAKVLISIDQDVPTPVSPQLPRKHRLPKLTSKYSLSNECHNPSYQQDESFSVNALAMEPTDDGIAAVGSFIFQLPGNGNAPSQCCLGSTLITCRILYPNPFHQPKSQIRYRTGSSTA